MQNGSAELKIPLFKLEGGIFSFFEQGGIRKKLYFNDNCRIAMGDKRGIRWKRNIKF
jgi:hypothetical protein